MKLHSGKLKFLLFLMALFITSALPIQKEALANSYEYQKNMEKSAVPEGADELVIQDLGNKRPLYSKRYEAYSKETGGTIITEADWLKYEAAAANDLNGIRFDITEYAQKGISGTTFGCSLQTKVDNWTEADNRENKSLLFFEIYDKDGKLKSATLLSSIKPKEDNSNLTTEEAKIGANWSYQLLKGESVLNFEATDKLYICVKQKSAVQCYDNVYLWSYNDLEEVMMPAKISKPVMNVAGDTLSFSVENLSGTDKEYNFLIRTYDNNVASKQRLYKMSVPSGTDMTQFQIPAKVGESISVYDEAGEYYTTDYMLSENIWVGTWGSAQLTPGSDTMPPSPGLSGNTYRQSVRVSTGGNVLRITFSNEYGATPLEINSAYIAHLVEYGNSKIDTSTNTLVTFNGGSSTVSIPAGKSITSDEIYFSFEPLDFIAVSTLFGNVPAVITSHTASRSTNCFLEGDHVTAEELVGFKPATSWYFLSEIDVLSPSESFAVVCFGDSITDGYGVEINKIQRWSDILADRLQKNPDTQHISVINKGIGGNAIFGGLGPAAYKRWFRDVCEPTGVKYVITMIGVNDIGFANSDNSQMLIAKYKEMIDVAHASGIKVYGGTILPFENNSYYSELHEQIRVKVNDWIKSEDSGLDGVIDFAAKIADPAKPSKMQDKYANDYLHPNAAGYAFLGEMIDLSIFTEKE